MGVSRPATTKAPSSSIFTALKKFSERTTSAAPKMFTMTRPTITALISTCSQKPLSCSGKNAAP
jgi:hypothetical protein